MTAADWPSVRTIYEEGIATGNGTFELRAPTWQEWDTAHLAACRLVATRRDQVVAWAALTSVSKRRVYAGVADVSVYVAAAARGSGVGSALLAALISESERAGVWTLQAGIFPENASSLKLHERKGFRVVGRRERIGQMNGRWRDVMLLERRSAHVGVGSVDGLLFHIASAAEVEAAAASGTYAPSQFDADRFIHCSYAHQVLEVADRIFRGRSGLVLLEIDRRRLGDPVVDENLEGGTELFPHLYGRLPMSAVVGVHPFKCDKNGRFEFPKNL